MFPFPSLKCLSKSHNANVRYAQFNCVSYLFILCLLGCTVTSVGHGFIAVISIIWKTCWMSTYLGFSLYHNLPWKRQRNGMRGTSPFVHINIIYTKNKKIERNSPVLCCVLACSSPTLPKDILFDLSIARAPNGHMVSKRWVGVWTVLAFLVGVSVHTCGLSPGGHKWCLLSSSRAWSRYEAQTTWPTLKKRKKWYLSSRFSCSYKMSASEQGATSSLPYNWCFASFLFQKLHRVIKPFKYISLRSFLITLEIVYNELFQTYSV